MLLWLARLGAAGTEAIQIGCGLSRATTYSHLARLRDARLVIPIPTGDGLGGIVAVTATGARVAVSHGVHAVKPRLSAYAPGMHQRATSWVAAAASRWNVEWFGPAQLRAGGWSMPRRDGRRHLPDIGFLSRSGGRCAVEVELHAKSADRLRAILDAYASRILRNELDHVIYVCDKPAVARLVDRHGRNRLRDRLVIETLDVWIERARMAPGPSTEA